MVHSLEQKWVVSRFLRNENIDNNFSQLTFSFLTFILSFQFVRQSCIQLYKKKKPTKFYLRIVTSEIVAVTGVLIMQT